MRLCPGGESARTSGEVSGPGGVKFTQPARETLCRQDFQYEDNHDGTCGFRHFDGLGSNGTQGSVESSDIPIQAVRISDDDGGRPAAISPRQVKRWVDNANAVYAHSGIRFRYEVSDGLVERKSTLLNNITGTGDGEWLQSKRLANRLAAEHPGRLTVLFRHGPGPNPTGGGFSWVDYDFVVMPGFDVTTICGKQNIGVFAHEAGHYLGLSHTFARVRDRRRGRRLAQGSQWRRVLFRRRPPVGHPAGPVYQGPPVRIGGERRSPGSTGRVPPE